jgi:hypothetical protein
VVPEKNGAAFGVGIFGEKTAQFTECNDLRMFRKSPLPFPFLHDRSILLLKFQKENECQKK